MAPMRRLTAKLPPEAIVRMKREGSLDLRSPPPPSRTKWTRLVHPSRTNWTRLAPSVHPTRLPTVLFLKREGSLDLRVTVDDLVAACASTAATVPAESVARYDAWSKKFSSV